jgi:homoserine kinase
MLISTTSGQGVRTTRLLEGRRFTFVDRIPRERGLGSSASVIASASSRLRLSPGST